jgi:hypothetical protein
MVVDAGVDDAASAVPTPLPAIMTASPAAGRTIRFLMMLVPLAGPGQCPALLMTSRKATMGLSNNPGDSPETKSRK